jgi:hypothetical protein
MSEMLLPMVEEAWKLPPRDVPWDSGEALRAELIQIGADVLRFVEGHGTTSLKQLIAALGQPAPLVTMALGGLVRDGAVRAAACPLDGVVDVEPRRTAVGAPRADADEVWGT